MVNKETAPRASGAGIVHSNAAASNPSADPVPKATTAVNGVDPLFDIGKTPQREFTVNFSRFESITNTRPNQKAMGFADVIAELNDPARQGTKKDDLPLFSLVEWKGTRSAANVAKITGVVVDYDGVPGSLEGDISVSLGFAAQTFEEAGLEGFGYTTPNHTFEQPRWRFVFPLANSVMSVEYKKLVEVLEQLSGIQFDSSSKRPEQIYYYGRARNAKTEYAFELIHGGQTLDEIAVAQLKSPAPITASTNIEATDAYTDALISALGDAGCEPVADGFHPYQHQIKCPWFEQHTDGKVEAAIFLPGYTDPNSKKVRSVYGFNCFHDHCEKRSFKDLLKWLNSAPRNSRLLRPPIALQFTVVAADGEDAKPRQSLADVFSGYRFDMATGRVWDLLSRNARPGDAWRRTKLYLTGDVNPLDILADERNGLIVDCGVWWPGQPLIIDGKTVEGDGEPINAPGRQLFNLYREPPIFDPNANPAEEGNLWVEHVRNIWEPEDADFILSYLAHALQHPDVKTSLILALVSAQGVGKDRMMQPVYQVLGASNCKGITPQTLRLAFNTYRQAIVITIDEMQAEEGHKRAWMYDQLKEISGGATPMTLVNKKYGAMYYVLDVARVVLKFNDSEALYIPPGDRRLYVAAARVPKEWAPPEYFRNLNAWCQSRAGLARIAAFLRVRDLSDRSCFDPHAPAPVTKAKRDIINQFAHDDDDGIDDAIERLGNPRFLTVEQMAAAVGGGAGGRILSEARRQNSMHFARRMQIAGYERMSPPKDGPPYWQTKYQGKKTPKAKYVYYRGDFGMPTDEEAWQFARMALVEAAKRRSADPTVVMFIPVGSDDL